MMEAHLGFHNRRVVWDTPVTKWANEGNDLVQKLISHLPKKDDVNIALLKMTRQPTIHLLKKATQEPSKKQNKGTGPRST